MISISQELATAARILEERFRILELPVCKCPQKDWDSLPNDIRNWVPSWIVELLSTYSLVGGWLEFASHRDESHPNLLAFFAPQGLELYLKPGSEYRDFIKYGYFPFAYEEASGSVWLVKVSDGPASKVYLLEYPGWSGGEPTSKNGLIYAHRNLACLLASVAISNANSGRQESGQIVRGMWED